MKIIYLKVSWLERCIMLQKLNTTQPKIVIDSNDTNYSTIDIYETSRNSGKSRNEYSRQKYSR